MMKDLTTRETDLQVFNCYFVFLHSKGYLNHLRFELHAWFASSFAIMNFLWISLELCIISRWTDTLRVWFKLILSCLIDLAKCYGKDCRECFMNLLIHRLYSMKHFLLALMAQNGALDEKIIGDYTMSFESGISCSSRRRSQVKERRHRFWRIRCRRRTFEVKLHENKKVCEEVLFTCRR